MKSLFLFFLAGAVASPASAKIADPVVRQNVAEIDLLLLPTEVNDVVILRGSLPAGRVFNPPDNPVLADVAAAMLDKGTTAHDKFAFAKQLEDAGASLTFSGGSHVVSVNGRCLKADVPLLLELLTEAIRTPSFPEDELAKLKKQLAAGWKRDLEDPGRRASQDFSRAIHDHGHPNWIPPIDERLAALDRITVDDLKAFHAAHYGPTHFILVLAGDLDRSQITQVLAKDFSGWVGGSALTGTPPTQAPGPAPHPAELVSFIRGKTSVSILWGQASGLRYTDPDALALRVGTAILGSGFTGRLMHAVRDRDGLTYGIGAGMGGDDFTDGEWSISGTFAPSLLDKGVASTRHELDTWLAQGVTATELANRKEGLIGSYQVSLATTTNLAEALLRAVQRGQSPQWLDEYPAKIAQLTLEDVNGAIQRHLHFEQMVLVKAGTVGNAPKTP